MIAEVGEIAPEASVRGLAWNAAQMQARARWRIDAPPGLARDAEALLAWAEGRADPSAALRAEATSTPAIDAIGARVAAELDSGSGVAWIRADRELPPLAMRLVFLKLGLTLGSTIDTYGRLYEVKDTGISYKDKPIPVSQTREPTGMHTDSSGRDIAPGVIGLGCIRQAPKGGASRLASSARAHEVLRARAPHLLSRLYQSYVRDVVTPGSARGRESVAANRFPVFAHPGRLSFRYMRYWIERGHARVGEPLADEAREAFDALDACLGDPEGVLGLRLRPGDMLFVDNTTVAHDRDGYVDDPAAPRLLLRMWLDRPRAPTSRAGLVEAP